MEFDDTLDHLVPTLNGKFHFFLHPPQLNISIIFHLIFKLVNVIKLLWRNQITLLKILLAWLSSAVWTYLIMTTTSIPLNHCAVQVYCLQCSSPRQRYARCGEPLVLGLWDPGLGRQTFITEICSDINTITGLCQCLVSNVCCCLLCIYLYDPGRHGGKVRVYMGAQMENDRL